MEKIIATNENYSKNSTITVFDGDISKWNWDSSINIIQIICSDVIK